jgi:arsenate reductase (thioredoxin)
MDRNEQFQLERQHAILNVVRDVAIDHGAHFSQDMIEAVVTESYDRLAENATNTQFLGTLAGNLTRKRLRALGKLDGSAPDNRPAVLFLCVHNAGRSQMALGWLTHLGGDNIVGYSGGSAPANEINPIAIAAMAEVGIDISHEFPKPWTDDIVRATDVVVLMGCGDACPVYPGKKYVEWTLDDPAGQGIEVVRTVRDEIRSHVELLLIELGITNPAA